jgi:hypothetical protein
MILLQEFIRSADSAFVPATQPIIIPMKLDTSWKTTVYKRMAGDISDSPVYL